MKILLNPSPEKWQKHLARPAMQTQKIKEIVKPIFEKVARNGDKALRKFAQEFDHVKLDSLLASPEEVQAAAAQLSPELIEAIALAKSNIEKFHAAQTTPELVVEVMPGVICSRKSVPIQRVGLYIPGGTAPLFSTVLMLGVPAALAGCAEVVLCTPTNKGGNIHPAILYTAQLVGISKIVKVGGAQAIAALTFGTESVPQVDKIFGPGNQYVTAAKQMATKYGVAIDMPAGPSEVLVYADETAIPAFVAADLLSQAEHGVDSQVVLVSPSEDFVKKVLAEIGLQLESLPRKDIAAKALKNSCAVILEDTDTAIALINAYAPEHLILALANEETILDKIYNAGSVFIGNFTPEAVGDYASGTNHTLPTNKAARYTGGLWVGKFLKNCTYQKCTPEASLKIGKYAMRLCELEGFMGHKEQAALRVRRYGDLES